MLHIDEVNKKYSNVIIRKNTERARDCYERIKRNSKVLANLEKYKDKMSIDLFDDFDDLLKAK